MTDTADLVKELREKALRDSSYQQLQAERTIEWQAASALEIYQTGSVAEIGAINPNVASYMQHWEGRAEKAEAELAEAKREIERLRGQVTFLGDKAGEKALECGRQRVRAESAESSLAQANERVKELEGLTQANINTMGEQRRRCQRWGKSHDELDVAIEDSQNRLKTALAGKE